MRDSKGRFKSKDLIIPMPNITMFINILIIALIFLPWIYVCFKFNLGDKIQALLNSIFFDESKCKCENLNNGDNKY